MELEPEVADTGKGQVAGRGCRLLQSSWGSSAMSCLLQFLPTILTFPVLLLITLFFFLHYLGYPVLIFVTCKVIGNIEKILHYSHLVKRYLKSKSKWKPTVSSLRKNLN